jgi:5,10-methylenetetrahydromethanopterin reductase
MPCERQRASIRAAETESTEIAMEFYGFSFGRMSRVHSKVYYARTSNNLQMVKGLRLGIKFSGDTNALRMARVASLAERLGFHSLWATESRFTRDAVSRAAMLAVLTKRVIVGTAVVNAFTRSLAVLASTAATIDEASRGRFILGLGAGGERFISSQGIGFERPLKRLEEFTVLLRQIWEGRSVSFVGQTIEVSGITLGFRPVRPRIPVYYGVTGNKAIDLASRLSDGIILNAYTSLSYNRNANRTIRGSPDGARLPVLGNVAVSMDPDTDAAILAAKPMVFTYVTSFPALAKANGVPESHVKELIELERKDGLKMALQSLDDKWVLELAAVGGPEECRKRVRQYAGVGLDEVLLTAISGNEAEVTREMSQLL